ncbi:MAG: M23 family metallopeptidase [Xanthomonadales bacterium]|nr:M23 family metallopeptidase [Xanthomonadales bacterium]
MTADLIEREQDNRPTTRACASAAPCASIPASIRLTPLHRWQREHWILASVFAAVTVLASLCTPRFADAHLGNGTEVMQHLVLDLPAQPSATLSPGFFDTPEWTTVRIESGQTLGQIFDSQGISARLLHQLLDLPGAREPLTRVRPGAEFGFARNAAGEFVAFRFERDETALVQIDIDGESLRQRVEPRDLQRRVVMTSGVIRSSLSQAASDAGMSAAGVLEMAKVFGYDIDFAQDLREGDRFSVVYEDIYRDGERLRSGEIVAATFVNQGRTYDVFRYRFADGRTEYFDGEGRPMKKSFLRMPIEYARISSRFSSARRHPVLGRVRAHRGVDYAAGTGTPIMAAGDGKVTYAGWQNGYGRVVIVDHGQGYTTLYGHMSRFGKYKTGARVRQGDTIGYVGMTGLASGPHLHYEFRVAGVHRDPLTVTLPKPQPLPASELARFQNQTQPMLARLQTLDATQRGLAVR